MTKIADLLINTKMLLLYFTANFCLPQSVRFSLPLPKVNTLSSNVLTPHIDFFVFCTYGE